MGLDDIMAQIKSSAARQLIELSPAWRLSRPPSSTTAAGS